jgi:hypothetical protein
MCCSKKFVLLFRYNNSYGAIALFMIIFASAAAEAIQAAAAVERIEEGFSRKTPAGASVIDSSKVFMTPASEKTCF